jgi:hypothetical protein
MTSTFRDFAFRARHHVNGMSPAASTEHWHSYNVRFYFTEPVDQDQLIGTIEKKFAHLHGSNLNYEIGGVTTDERLAEWFLNRSGACRVILTNDGQRGAEASP